MTKKSHKTKQHYQDKVKIGDYYLYCDQCSQPCWESLSTKLDNDTGKDGLVVCPNCIDATDYGLIPFVVRPEDSIPVVRINQTNTDTIPQEVNLVTYDPLSGTNLE